MTVSATLAAALLGEPVATVSAVSGGDISRAARVTTAAGDTVFVKVREDAPEGFFATEAAGLRWLADGGAPVPRVRAVTARGLALDWYEPGPPTAVAAAELGRALADLHRAGADAFGALPPGSPTAFVGSLPVPVEPSASAAEHLARRWVAAAAAAGLPADVRADLDRLGAILPDRLGPPEPPARLHGDLWAGNVHWLAGGGAILIDPAAHGGHRETDLAMLDLFGCPNLETIRSSYEEVSPLSTGWRARILLHQIHPLLVHSALFGGGYAARAAAAIRAYL